MSNTLGAPRTISVSEESWPPPPLADESDSQQPLSERKPEPEQSKELVNSSSIEKMHETDEISQKWACAHIAFHFPQVSRGTVEGHKTVTDQGCVSLTCGTGSA